MLKKRTKKTTRPKAGKRKKQSALSEPKRVDLRNGCWRTRINVTPSNYLDNESSMQEEWTIWYRYHDPLFKKKYPKGKYIPKKGMNDQHDWQARIASTKLLIDEIKTLIDVHHYNPITERINAPESEISASTVREMNLQKTELAPTTLFIPALWAGLAQLPYVPRAIRDVKSIIRGTEKGAKAFSFDLLPISDIRPKHFIKIFNWLREKYKYSFLTDMK